MANSHISHFIQSLNADELKYVKKYIYSENKLTKLLCILTEKPEKNFSDEELAKLLNTSSQSIRVTKSKLFGILKEKLLSDEHLENKNLFNEIEIETFKLRKQMVFVKSIFRRLNKKRVDTAKILLDDIITNAKKYEIFHLVIEALILKKIIVGIRHGIDSYNTINREIQFFEYCFKAVNSAYDSFYLLILNQEFISSLSKKEYKQHINSSIIKLKNDYKETKAQEVNYFMTFLKVASFENERNYKKALLYCKKLILSLQGSKVLYTKDRIGFVMANITQFNVFLGNFKVAAKNAQNAQKFHLQDSFNTITLREQEFYAHFYDYNFIDAQKCLNKIISHPLADTGGFRNAKFVFYQACLLFLRKQFKEALQLLNKPLEIEKDKAHWNISVRILNILIFIELSKIKEANVSIEALRKHLERLNTTNKVEGRDLLIIKLLRELQKDNFNLNHKNLKATQLLKVLSQKNKPTSWNYFTPELIPFHEWVITLPVKN